MQIVFVLAQNCFHFLAWNVWRNENKNSKQNKIKKISLKIVKINTSKIISKNTQCMFGMFSWIIENFLNQLADFYKSKIFFFQVCNFLFNQRHKKRGKTKRFKKISKNYLLIIFLDFQDQCFASTKCKVYPPGEGWSLAPFCGQSRCVKLSKQIDRWLDR